MQNSLVAVVFYPKYFISLRTLPKPLTPKLAPSRRLYAVSPDARFLFTGGHWDNSLQVSEWAAKRKL